MTWCAGSIRGRMRTVHERPPNYSPSRRSDRGTSADRGTSGRPAERAAGTILVAHGDDLSVQTGRGAVAIRQLQSEGKRPMTPREFLAGHRLISGDRFLAEP